MRFSIEFKTGRYDGHTWVRVTPKVEGTNTQRIILMSLFLAILTVSAFAFAGTIAPDPIIKPDQTVVMGWGQR